MTHFNYSIGDVVEVFCDHKRGGRRIRDWVEGVVVHADDRMTAIQFRNDVYLTDGWMVPDRILWFNKGSGKIRAAKKPQKKARVPTARRVLKTIRKGKKTIGSKQRKSQKRRRSKKK